MYIKMHSIRFDADQKLKNFIDTKVKKLPTVYDDILGAEVYLRLDKDSEQRENKLVEIKLEVKANRSSPKSNAAYMAIENALSLVTKHGDLPVPLHLRNAPTRLMKTLDYVKHYTYSHDGKNNFIEQEYLPDKISGNALYLPGANAREEEIRKFLKNRWGNKYNY